MNCSRSHSIRLAGFVLVGALLGTAGRATSIPVWLDEGIAKWNAEHSTTPIRFVDIKDSFVWYDVPRSAELGHPQLREGVNRIVLANGYQPMDDEELITTARPPVTSGRTSSKKCWNRSFVLNIQSQSNTKAVGEAAQGQRQRMLTNLVCEDAETYWLAFRIIQ